MISNNKTKQFALTAALLALTFAPGIAFARNGASQSAPQAQTQDQSQAAPAQNEGRKHGMMKNLNLTDDQKAQFKKIHESTKSQAEAVKNDGSLTAEQKQSKIHELRRDARTQMEKLLTPEQRAQMKANMRELRASRREKQPTTPQTQPQG